LLIPDCGDEEWRTFSLQSVSTGSTDSITLAEGIRGYEVRDDGLYIYRSYKADGQPAWEIVE